MFAVPGWAVSSDGLKAETAVKQSPGQNEPSNSKKRKRPSVPTTVTSSNVADLWEQVIEGRSEKKSKPDQGSASAAVAAARPGSKKGLTLKEKKKLKKLKAQEEHQDVSEQGRQDGKSVQGTDKQTTESADVGGPGKEPKKKDKKKKKNDSKDHQGSQKNSEGAGEEDEVQAGPASAPVLAAPKLTPMQAAMREKLVSARFRHLNETLYTKPSADAFQLFEDSPEMFQEYHEGFRRQVDVWPENPVDGYIADIRQRGAQRTPASHHHHRRDNKPRPAGGNEDDDAANSSSIQPLPRTSGTCTVADLGCGDGKLAAALQSDRKRLGLRVLSYDLQSPSPHVTRADVADLPLPDGAVDVAVFCLALMGTNWLDFVDEAYRVLHWKGELWVAEIKSRFGAGGATKQNAGGPVLHSVGNRRKIPAPGGAGAGGKKNKGKGGSEKAEEHDGTDLAVEVDGAEDRRHETDVSAFVEALRKRGFLLQHGGGAVDLRNKMFVKMRFVKAATPTAGKGVAAAAAREAKRGRGGRDGDGGGGGGGGGGGLANKKKGIKFIEKAGEEEQGAVDENSILKPCVYKIR